MRINIYFGLNLPILNLLASFLNARCNHNILPSVSNSILRFALSIVLESVTKLFPFDKRYFENKNIIIKETNKGSTVVTLERELHKEGGKTTRG